MIHWGKPDLLQETRQQHVYDEERERESNIILCSVLRQWWGGRGVQLYQIKIQELFKDFLIFNLSWTENYRGCLSHIRLNYTKDI